jgi:hypothetical protein
VNAFDSTNEYAPSRCEKMKSGHRRTTRTKTHGDTPACAKNPVRISPTTPTLDGLEVLSSWRVIPSLLYRPG